MSTSITQQDTSLEDHIQTFENTLNLSPRSVDNYTSSVKRFYRLTGRTDPIDPTKLNEVSTSRLAEELSEHITSQSMKYALLKYFDWLQQRAPSVEAERTILFFRNKVEKNDPGTNSRDIGEKVLSSDKVKEIVKTAPTYVNSGGDQVRLLLQLMYDTATRISGMIWLEWQDVKREEYAGEPLDDLEMLIHQDRSKSETSGIVELSPATRQLLEEHEDRIPSTDPETKVFFPDLAERSVYQKIYRCFKKAAAECGVPDASMHWFRHSQLTHLGMEMREAGQDYAQIKERLRRYGRHKQADTTEVYIKILKQKKAGSINQYRTVSWHDHEA